MVSVNRNEEHVRQCSPGIRSPGQYASGAEELGLFHPTAARIHEVASEPVAEVQDLARAVAMDPLLAARLLKLANSPFYGRNKKITTLKHAIGVLGFRTTRDLAIAMCVGGKAEKAGDEARAIWKHSMRTGTAYPTHRAVRPRARSVPSADRRDPTRRGRTRGDHRRTRLIIPRFSPGGAPTKRQQQAPTNPNYRRQSCCNR